MKKNLLKRLYLNDSLSTGQMVELTTNQSHYLRNVIRLSEKDNLLVFNERDGEWLVEISSLTKKSCYCSVIEQKRPTYKEPELTLAFAPVKGDALENIIQKATELGATTLQPIITDRTIVKKINLDKWQSYITDAAEQCERTTLPIIQEPSKLYDFVNNHKHGTILWCDETGNGKALATIKAESHPPNTVLVGPEGGFTLEEIQFLKKAPLITPISIFPRILRADTACIATLSCWQALYGDWKDKHPSFRFDETI